MSGPEKRAVAVLGGIYGLRMFGLFLVLPVLALYADDLLGATPTLIGLALGAYGLTQAVFQIPFGLASDHFGRKPVIVTGLLVFALGSAVAAMASTIEWMIFGRAMQGAGAIAAVVLALTADLTREEQRAKAVAFIGMSIGAAFLLALMAGPLLAAWVGVSGLFWFTAALAVGAIVMVASMPTPAQSRHTDVQASPRHILASLTHPELLRLNIGVFTLHLVLTALFVAVPVVLSYELGLASERHWQIYVPVLVLSAAAMLPLVFLASRKAWIPRIYLGAIAILLVGEALLFFGFRSLGALGVALWVFFWGFNTLEALLPSLVSRIAPVGRKGTAIGVFNTFQFLGVFVGGTCGGWLMGQFGVGSVFVTCAALATVWLLVTLASPAPVLADTRLVRVGRRDSDDARGIAQRLSGLPGVLEVTVVAEEGVAYLKIDAQAFDEERLREFAV